jgi:hypothetical protein
MAKKNLIALAATLFVSYHKAKAFFFTSDDTPFSDEYSAKNHAATLTDKTVTPVTRDEAVETIELNNSDLDATLRQMLSESREDFASLFGFAAPDHLIKEELEAAMLCHNLFVDQLRAAYKASNPDTEIPLFFRIEAVPLFPVIKLANADATKEVQSPTHLPIHVEGVEEPVVTITLTDNQPAQTNNDVVSDAAGTVQEQAPAAKAATEEKLVAIKKAKAPKVKPAVEPVATEQAEKPSGEQSEQPAAEQPVEPAAEQQTENN